VYYIYLKKKQLIIELVLFKYLCRYIKCVYEYIKSYKYICCAWLYTNDLYWYLRIDNYVSVQLISTSANSHVQCQWHKTLLLYTSDGISILIFLLLLLRRVVSYLKPFWNVVACVLFSPFVHVCRRFFPSFTHTPIPLAAVVSTFIDHRQRRGGVEK